MSPIAMPEVTEDISVEVFEEAKAEKGCELPLHGKLREPLTGDVVYWHADGGPVWLHSRSCNCPPRIVCDRYREYLQNEYLARRGKFHLNFGVCATCRGLFDISSVSFVPIGD